MRVQRSLILRLTGRNPGSKSPALASGATEPTMRSTGISWTPPKARPSRPAARSTGSMERRRWARPVRIVRSERRNARARAASKSWMARMRSTPKSTATYRWLQLQKRLLALGVEEVQRAGVQPKLHTVARGHVQPRVDSSRDLVTADHPVQVLVGAKALDDVDLHLQGWAAIRHAVGQRLGA